MNSCYIALDIGTTTLCAALCDSNGDVLQRYTCYNPQRVFGADVISRILACDSGKTSIMQKVLLDEVINIKGHFEQKCPDCCIKDLYVCANTVMTYIFCGRSASSLGKHPFIVDFKECLELYKPKIDIGFENIYVLPCASAFIGSDVLCSAIYSGMLQNNEPSMLIDIGTNGEIVLFSGKRSEGKDIFACSAAAGGAFEGANISCGINATQGAICRSGKIEASNRMYFCTIDNKTPMGICGSGLCDIVAYLKNSGIIDSHGTFCNGNNVEICGYFKTQKGEFLYPQIIETGITVTQNDIRQFQSAKGAICAGVEILTGKANINASEIKNIYVTGNFGSYLNSDSLKVCKMLPEGIGCNIVNIASGALGGVMQFAYDKIKKQELFSLKEKCVTVNLAQQKDFGEVFIKNLDF